MHFRFRQSSRRIIYLLSLFHFLGFVVFLSQVGAGACIYLQCQEMTRTHLAYSSVHSKCGQMWTEKVLLEKLVKNGDFRVSVSRSSEISLGSALENSYEQPAVVPLMCRARVTWHWLWRKITHCPRAWKAEWWGGVGGLDSYRDGERRVKKVIHLYILFLGLFRKQKQYCSFKW